MQRLTHRHTRMCSEWVRRHQHLAHRAESFHENLSVGWLQAVAAFTVEIKTFFFFFKVIWHVSNLNVRLHLLLHGKPAKASGR